MASIQNWFGSLNISESDNTDHRGALLDLLASGMDASYYYGKFNVIINNLSYIEKDSNGKYFVELQIPRDGDILKDFQMYIGNASISLNINGVFIPFNNLIIPICSAPYTMLKLRITFIGEPFNFKIRYKSYVLQSDLINMLMHKDIIQNNIRYTNGMAMPI